MAPAGLVVASLNSIWQSALLALLAWVALRLTNAHAAARAAVWTAVLIVGAGLLPLDLAFESATPAATLHAVRPAPHSMLAGQAGAPVWWALRSIRDEELDVARFVSAGARRIGLLLLGLWLAVSACRLIRVWQAARDIRALKRSAAPLGDDAVGARLRAMTGAVRGARIGLCDGLAVPCAVGFAKPMILLPRALFTRLEAEDAYAAVAHEIAHLSRRDDLIVVVQAALEALFFFNPILLIASHRVDFYREVACDDRTVSSRASALRYAECLATILERAVAGQRAAAPALLHGRTQVFARVERLVNWKEAPHSMGRATLLIALGISAAALFFVRIQLPLLSPARTVAFDGQQGATPAHDDDNDGLLGSLRAAGYRPSPDDAIALANAGVDSDLVDVVERSGIDRPSVSGLIELANAGVDQDLIQDAVHAFGAGTSVSDLVRLQNSGVDGDDVADLRAVTCPETTISDIIALHDAGIDADYIRHLGKSYERLSAHDIIRMHDAGVDS